jgi:23S rRNA (guanosine2251-2'-O)-methyltransferase
MLLFTGTVGSLDIGIVSPSEAFGVDAIIIPNDRSVQITSTVVKTSVGTIEKVKIVNVPNINNAIRKLKDLGYWIVGTDMEGTNYTEIDYKTKIGLVIGNEGKGSLIIDNKVRVDYFSDNNITIYLANNLNKY